MAFLSKLALDTASLNGEHDRLADLLVEVLGRSEGDAGARVEHLERALTVGDDENVELTDPRYPLLQLRRERRGKDGHAVAEAVRSLAHLVERPGSRLGMPRAMANALCAALDESRRSLADRVSTSADRIKTLRGTWDDSESGESNLREFIELRVRLAVASLLIESIGAVEAGIGEFVEAINGLRAALPPVKSSGEAAAPAVIEELDRRTQAILDARAERFGALLRDDAGRLFEVVAKTARALAVETLVTSTLRSVGRDGVAELVRRMYAAARPQLPVRGQVRLVLVAPTAELAKYLSPAGTGVAPTVVVDPNGTPGVLWETTGLPYAHVAARFVGDRATVLQLADRLHTRVDVDWRA